jgi:two-component system, NarL family, response regulator LiaR
MSSEPAKSAESTIRILIADDHPVVRDGLVAILSTQPDFEIVGAAASGQEAVELASTVEPDILLVDLEMPGMDGVEVIHQVKTANSNIQAIVFTAFDTDERILGAVKAGATGYLLKGAPREELFKAIRLARQGGSLLQPLVASRLLHHVATEPHQVPALTARESEVLQLLAQGKTNKEIAETLVVTERTAKFHVSSILDKLGANNRTEAVTLAAQLGLVDL